MKKLIFAGLMMIAFTNVYAQPTIQASNIVFTMPGTTTMAFNWTNGDGASRMVIVKTVGSAFTPIDGTTYTANSNFTIGSDLDGGGGVTKCVYSGTGNSVTVTGLTANTTYTFQVYEFDNCCGAESFLTTNNTGNPASKSTLAMEPTTQANSLIFSSQTSSSMNVNWTDGNGSGRILICKIGNTSIVAGDFPVDGASYTGNTNFASAPNIGPNGAKVIAVGNISGITGVTVTGLSSSSNYSFRLMEFNGMVGTGAENFNLINSAANPANATTLAPGAVPIITAATIPNTSMQIGDIVTATITVNSSAETFTLLPSSINGFALYNLVKLNNTTYTAQFIIPSGGSDVASGSNIPVNIILNGSSGNSTAFTTAISQCCDPIDVNAPTVTGVSSPLPNGAYPVGQVIPITVTFSEPVTVSTGIPKITLETGATDRIIDYTSGSGTNTLTFNYTVQTGDITADLDYLANSLVANPLHKSNITNGTGGALLATSNSVFVLDNYAYVVGDNDALEILNITNPASPSHVGNITDGQGGALLNGAISVFVSGNYAYVACTVSSGTLEIVNVSNPANPVHAGSIVNLGSVRSVFVSGNYAYVTNSAGSLEIINVTNPLLPVLAGSIDDGDGGALLGGARYVQVVDNYAYVASNSDNALEIVDVSDPANPVHVASLSDGETGAMLIKPYGLYVLGNYVYMAIEGNPDNTADLDPLDLEDALEIIDISNPSNPFHVGSVTHNPPVGALLDKAQAVYVSGNYAYVGSFISDALTIVDVSNPASPQHRTSIVNGSGGALLDAINSVQVQNNYAYVVGYSSNALEIIDVSPIRDAANNRATLTLPAPGAAGSLSANKNIVVDTVFPTVINVTSSTPNGTYGIGSLITVTVNFSEVVNVIGTPTITLETGTTDRAVNYTSGTGTTTLTFNYTVQVGDVSPDLEYLNTTALVLNGGSIKDVANNDAILTLPSLGAGNSLGESKAIVIDGIAPAAPSVPDLASADDAGLSNSDNITSNDASLTLTGTAESGALVTFTESGLGVLGSVTATGGNYSFDFDIGSGTYNITATAQDAAGNVSPATAALTITVDTGNPTVTINQGGSQSDPTAAVPVTFDVVFSKAINPATFTGVDIAIGGTATGITVASLTTANNINWVLTITATGPGTIIPSLPANLIQDIAGNTNAASTSTDNTVTYNPDTTPPTVTITTTATEPTAVSPIPVTITFSENVTGFILADISVTNGTAGSFVAVNATTYTASITPTAAGVVTVTVNAGVATDAATNGNTVSNILSRTYTPADTTPPTVTITSTATEPTAVSPIPVTITFSENVTGFILADISVTNGTAGSFVAVNATTYTASITPTAAGVVTVTVNAGVATDAATNGNTVSNILSRTYTPADTTPPTVTITSTATEPTAVSPIPVTITFSENVTGFILADISVTNGTAGSFVAVNATTYTASITPTAAGVVTVTVNAGVATDAATNGNTVSNILSRTYTPADTTPPTVTITSTATEPTAVSPIPVTITFSENVTGFILADISVTNGTAGSFVAVNATTYTASITPTAAGVVTVTVNAGVATDAATNGNTVSNILSRTYTPADTTPPTVTITSTATEPTAVSPIPVTITFSENVTGFILADISVTNGTAGSFVAVNGSTYTASITPAAAGVVTVTVNAGVATDAATNGNTVSNILSRTYAPADTTPPTVTITSTATEPTAVSPIPVTITFSENVTGFILADISVTNGTAGSFVAVNGSTYTASITPTAAGVVTVTVNAGVATDAATNGNTVSNILSRTYTPADTTPPTVTITSTATEPTAVSPIPVTITFSENVTGFILADISVTNGTAGSFVAVNATTYTASITPTAAGVVTVTVNAGVATDAATNGNTVSNILSRTYTPADTTPPTVTITSTATEPTAVSPIPVTITFSENVTGFILADISVTNGTAGSFVAVNGSTYTASITPTAAGVVTVTVNAGVATDAATNGNTVSNILSRTYTPADTTPPTVTITSTATEPTAVSPIPVTITFSENVTGFILADISVTNGTAGSFVAVNGSTYTASITPTAAGVVTVTVNAGVATDAATNGNTVSNILSRTYEVLPEVALLINSFITPNTADDQNNVLFIENIEFFPENNVKLMDRWGVPIKSWTNFANYESKDAEQADFNFMNLDIGNYICIVEYINPNNGNKKNLTQMITVLK